jgi:hypothetical protein
MVLGAIPTSGLTDNAPLLSKIVGMVIAALAAINYTAHRTALKRAYIAAVASVTATPQISRLPQLAASALLVAVVGVLAVAPMSCGGALNCQDPKNTGSVACVVGGAVVDCTGVSSLPSAVVTVTPIVEKLVAAAHQPDGTYKWSASIEQQLVDLALQYGMCVISEVWNQLTSPSPAAGSGSVLVARAAPSAALTEEFDRLRARVAPGRQFKTSRGTR